MRTTMTKGFLWCCLVAPTALLPACNNGSTPTQTPAVRITIASVPDGVTGQAYDQTLTATGGAAPLSWTVSTGTLPDGLGLDPSTGALTGTPTTPGTFDFTVEVGDSSSPALTAAQDFAIHVADPLVVTSSSLANGSDGAVYSQTVATSGGLAPLSFSVSAGSLPDGLALDATTGEITGTPTNGGSFDFTIQVSDSLNPTQTASQAYTVLIFQITSTSLSNGVQDQDYGPETLAVAGQVDPVEWAISAGSLPAGTSLDTSTGEISGTPTGSGTSSFTVQVTDSDSPARSDTQDLSLTILPQLGITTTSLPNATQDVAYDQSIQATGGVSPYVWTEPSALFDETGAGSSGTACEGLTFDVDATGASTTISGTPVNTGTCGPFTAHVDDSGGPAQSTEQSLSIEVLPAGRFEVVERVNLADDGTQADKNSDNSSISADGRFVAFVSSATDLVTGDTNHYNDAFVRDTCQGATDCTPSTLLVSVADDGTLGNYLVPMTTPRPIAISADGRFVAFSSGASTMVADDTNGAYDAFVRDTCQSSSGLVDGCTPSTIRADLRDDGAQSSAGLLFTSGPKDLSVAISAHGRFVAFVSLGSLVADDSNGQGDVYVRDTCEGATSCAPSTTLVSVATDGTQGDHGSGLPSISADGRFVAFLSDATTLVADDTNATNDVFVRDTCWSSSGAVDGCTPSTTRVSVASDGTEGTSQNFWPSISADGRFVAFVSDSDNLVDGDTGGRDVFVHDTCQSSAGPVASCTPSTVRVNVSSDGSQVGSIGVSDDPTVSISADGRFVAFGTHASNLVPGITNSQEHIFVRDTCQGATDCTPSIKMAVGYAGSLGGGFTPSLSADGRFVAFTSWATNLVPDDTNNQEDIFLARTDF